MRNPITAPRRKYGREPRHHFVLNPHPDTRCTRCPKCEALMKVRKVPLLIHVDPQTLFTLRKTVKLCPACDLLIVHKDELEQQLAYAFHDRQPEILGNPYLVLGTLEVADWKEGVRQPTTAQEMIARHHPFKDELELHVSPGGWYQEDPVPEEHRRPRKKRRAPTPPSSAAARPDLPGCGA
jgi:hypothetical protein